MWRDGDVGTETGNAQVVGGPRGGGGGVVGHNRIILGWGR